jgi:hypothetical protein
LKDILDEGRGDRLEIELTEWELKTKDISGKFPVRDWYD